MITAIVLAASLSAPAIASQLPEGCAIVKKSAPLLHPKNKRKPLPGPHRAKKAPSKPVEEEEIECGLVAFDGSVTTLEPLPEVPFITTDRVEYNAPTLLGEPDGPQYQNGIEQFIRGNDSTVGTSGGIGTMVGTSGSFGSYCLPTCCDNSSVGNSVPAIPEPPIWGLLMLAGLVFTLKRLTKQ